MRIAIIADPIDNQNAGVHVYTKEMVRALLANDETNEYIIIRQKKGEALSTTNKNYKEIILPNVSLPIGYASFRLFFVIPYILRKERVDLVIEPAHFGPFNLPRRVLRMTVIHDLSAVLFPEWHHWHSGVLQKLFLPRILKRSDFILTNSYTTENELHKYYPFTKNKTWMIYPGIKALPAPSDEKTLAEKYQIKKSKYFLFVGTIEPRKNLSLLLEAFQAYKTKTNDDSRLIIVGGKGWKNEKFHQLLAAHPFHESIELTGYVSDETLQFLYAHAAVFVYPSQYEGFGFPVLEAMLAGTSVVTTANTSMDEISKPYAILFENNNATDLSNKLKLAMDKHVSTSDMDIKSTEKKDVQKLAEKFNWTIFAKSFLEQLVAIRPKQ